MEDMLFTVVASILTGVVSSVGTIKALHVHIFYLRAGLDDMEQRLNNHSSRINALEIKVGK